MDLTGTKIGDRGAVALAQALEVNRSLISIYLDDNKIGNEGAAKLTKALQVNKSLKFIFLHDNIIGDRVNRAGAGLASQ
jgi:Ran GTPase-activating protein (RanGAP) involved in mRNA processing and transport